MDEVEVEKQAKKVHKLRKERVELNEKIKAITDKIKDYMNENKKEKLSLSGISLRLVKRDRRTADYELIESYIAKGILPKNAISRSKTEILKISAQADIQLQGNKWVKK